MPKPKKVPEHTADEVRDISEAVYCDRLGAADTATMIEKDGDDGVKLRARAGGFDVLTRSYLRVLNGG